MGRSLSAFRFSLLAGVILSAILTLSGCGGDNTPLESDELDRAAYLIDKGQYSEAIYILETRSAKQEPEIKVRVLLASAYAARSGLFLSSFKDFAAELLRLDREGIESETIGDPLLDRLSRYAWQIHVVLKAFSVLPVPQTPSAIADVEKSLSILDEAGDLKAGPATYRALLRAVLFKQFMGEYRFRSDRQCRIRQNELRQWLARVSHDLQFILSDIAGGTSDVNAQERLRSSAESVASWVRQSGLARRSSDPAAEEFVRLPREFRKSFGVCD